MESMKDDITGGFKNAWLEVYGAKYPKTSGGVNMDNSPEEVISEMESAVRSLIEYAGEDEEWVLDEAEIPTEKRLVNNWIEDRLHIEKDGDNEFVEESTFKDLHNQCWGALDGVDEFRAVRTEGT